MAKIEFLLEKPFLVYKILPLVALNLYSLLQQLSVSVLRSSDNAARLHLECHVFDGEFAFFRNYSGYVLFR